MLVSVVLEVCTALFFRLSSSSFEGETALAREAKLSSCFRRVMFPRVRKDSMLYLQTTPAK